MSDTLTILCREDMPMWRAVVAGGYVADSTNLNHLGKVIGISITGNTSGAKFQVQRDGLITTQFWNWTIGAPIYVNNKVLSQTPPTTGVVQRVGFADTPRSMVVELGCPTVISDTDPSVIPSAIGIQWLVTSVPQKIYVSFGTSSISDWLLTFTNVTIVNTLTATFPYTKADYWRWKADGTFQFWNPDAGKWYPLVLWGDPTGTSFDTYEATDADTTAPPNVQITGKWRINSSGVFQLWNPDSGQFHHPVMFGGVGQEGMGWSSGENYEFSPTYNDIDPFTVTNQWQVDGNKDIRFYNPDTGLYHKPVLFGVSNATGLEWDEGA